MSTHVVDVATQQDLLELRSKLLELDRAQKELERYAFELEKELVAQGIELRELRRECNRCQQEWIEREDWR